MGGVFPCVTPLSEMAGGEDPVIKVGDPVDATWRRRLAEQDQRNAARERAWLIRLEQGGWVRAA